MDQQTQKINTPDYKKIFTDIINLHCPQKLQDCKPILNKKQISPLDVIKLKEMIFGKETKTKAAQNQKYRSYNSSAINEILKYQKDYNLSNSDLAKHFKLSRNSISKWKKLSKSNLVDDRLF